MASDFVWFELVTPDAVAAEAFYKTVVGWTTEASSGPNGPYTIFKAGQIPVGGMLEMKDVPPGWLGYIGVDDVDDFAQKIEAAGGAICKPPQDIPNVGRFAVVADPQGAMFVLFRGEPSEDPPRATPMSPGSLSWSELLTTDWEKAFDVYAPLFGWVKHQAVPMGEMGLYQTVGPPGAEIAGLFNNPMPGQAPHWLYYFGSSDVDAMVERVKSNGGEILMGPVEVPGGAWAVNAKDPQGALFGFVGARG